MWTFGRMERKTEMNANSTTIKKNKNVPNRLNVTGILTSDTTVMNIVIPNEGKIIARSM